MKLYDVPRNTMILLSGGLVLKFHHIDGRFSVCTDEDGDVYHIDATADVEIVKDEEE